MPVYEYQCQACGRPFEYQQRMSDPDKTDCEACGGRLERLISRTAFALKGGGWYKDLYSSTKPAESGASAAATSGDKPAPSGDKPAPSGDKAAAPAPAAAPASSGASGGGSGGGSTGGAASS
jgi:putative FmdB family regulatory protein